MNGIDWDKVKEIGRRGVYAVVPPATASGRDVTLDVTELWNLLVERVSDLESANAYHTENEREILTHLRKIEAVERSGIGGVRMVVEMLQCAVPDVNKQTELYVACMRARHPAKTTT